MPACSVSKSRVCDEVRELLQCVWGVLSSGQKLCHDVSIRNLASWSMTRPIAHTCWHVKYTWWPIPWRSMAICVKGHTIAKRGSGFGAG